MLFSSHVFLFLFLPVVLFMYFFCPKRFLKIRNGILLVFSLVFYFYGEPKYIVLLLFSIVINYTFGMLIYFRQLHGKNGKDILIISIIANVAILVFFKYLAFIADNLSFVFNPEFVLPEILMPIGISFFTFQAMSYIIDIYTKTTPVQKNPLNVALYISMFPQLMAGPIVRYNTIANEMLSRNITVDDVSAGMSRFVYGLGKKVIIADTLGQISDAVFSTQTDLLSMPTAWLGAIAYSFQIYYDFSGYSDMAIGLGRIFGFTFLENFNFPYISKSITEFWRRWHISLGTWFRDYVYIPLGGNRVSASRNMFNIFFVWALTGFWHGASWTFIAWGLYYAIILVIEKYTVKTVLSRAPGVSHFYALLLIIVGWVIFRSGNFSYAFGYISKMFNPVSDLPYVYSWGQANYYIAEYYPEWLAAIVFAMPVGKFLSRVYESIPDRLRKTRMYEIIPQSIRLVSVFAVFVISIVYLVGSSFRPFIYFRF